MSGTDLAGITSSTRAQAVVHDALNADNRSPAQGAPVDECSHSRRRQHDGMRHAGLPPSVIHELRTPLTSIHGYAQVLQRSLRDNARATNALGVVVRESTRLSAMLASLSEMAELESGELFSPAVDVEVHQVVDDVVHEVARRDSGSHPIRAEGRGLARCNPTLLSQALIHVITNATIFSPPGTPIVVITTQHRDFVETQVIDEGPGIDPADADRIYEPFERGADVRRAAIRGLGLGLYLARESLERTHGSLDHRSRDQGGTTFRLRLPSR